MCVEMALVRADRLTATERAMASAVRGTPPPPRMEVSAELLGQSDDDALGATQEAEPIAVLVLRDLADDFATVAAQARNDVVDVVDSEHDAAYAQRVRRREFRLGSDRRRRVKPRQLDPAVTVRGPHHGDVGTDVVEPDGAVHRRPLDRRLAFQLHTEFGEERFGSLEVIDNDENVVHPLKRHIVVSWCRGPRLSRPFTWRAGPVKASRHGSTHLADHRVAGP